MAALQLVGVGAAANDGTGDDLRTAFQKFNTVVNALSAAGWTSTGSNRPVVDFATAAALATNAYTAGVITASANGALSVDGNAPTVGQRILVKDEASQLKNGVYVVTAAGSAGAPFVLTRAGDYDSFLELSGCLVIVEGGATNAETVWQSTANDNGTIGTTAVPFVEASAGTINSTRWAYLAAASAFAGPLLAAANLAAFITSLGGAAAVQAALSLVPGTNVQAYSANLVTYAGIAPSANAQTLLGHTFGQMLTDIGAQAASANLTTYAGIAPSANAQTLLAHTFAQMQTDLGFSANGVTLIGHTFAQMKVDLALTIGTNVQAWNTNLDNLAGFTTDTDATMAANSNTRLATQAAVVSYIASKLDGRSWKQTVRAATTANGTLATAYANGQTIDGVVLATGDRILLKDQTAPAENGIYTVNASGAPTRATDADAGAELVDATVPVSEGTVNADRIYNCTNNATITVGTTALVWVQVGSASTSYTADETTLHLAGTVFSIKANGVTNSELRQGAATSLVGRSANSTGNLADIAASSDDTFLARTGGALSFTTLTSGMLGTGTFITGLTQDTAPDAAADFTLSWDASASAFKKVLHKNIKPTETWLVPVSDETTAITTGTGKVTFRAPYAFTLTDIRANVNTVSSSGLPTINVKKNGTTIFSTNLSIDATEKTSVTAATAYVFTGGVPVSIADDDEITIDITVAGTGAKGLKVAFIGYRA